MPRSWLVKQFRSWWHIADYWRAAGEYERSIAARATALLFAELVAES